MNDKMNYSNEIQNRIDSDLWSQKISNNVTVKVKRKQRINRIFISLVASLVFAFGFSFSELSVYELLDSSVSELSAYRIFLSDDVTPMYESIYQEERLSSLIEPISYFVK